MRAWIAMFCVAGLLGGCAGLSQFPVASTNYEEDIKDLDPNYNDALTEIQDAAGNPTKQAQIRNEEIDRRLRVIDLHFADFEKGLARENVGADFLVGVTEVGVGAAGALVAETVSQILSAVSGGLAGTRAAYTKAALFDKTLSALLGQMIAGRKTVLTRILDGRKLRIDQYPLSAAVQDLEAYAFAGSLPGAVVGTSADAKVKNDQAEKNLITIKARRSADFVDQQRQGRVDSLLDSIDDLADAKAFEIVLAPPVSDVGINTVVSARDPNNLRASDANVAREMLKMRVVLSNRDDAALDAWEAAIRAAE